MVPLCTPAVRVPNCPLVSTNNPGDEGFVLADATAKRQADTDGVSVGGSARHVGAQEQIVGAGGGVGPGIGAECRIEPARGVGIERPRATGRVAVARAVGIERLSAAGRVVAARDVAMQRRIAAGRVLVARGVGVERLSAAGRVGAALSVGTQGLMAAGRVLLLERTLRRSRELASRSGRRRGRPLQRDSRPQTHPRPVAPGPRESTGNSPAWSAAQREPRHRAAFPSRLIARLLAGPQSLPLALGQNRSR